MLVLEALLLTILLMTLGISSYTDCQDGIIRNKLLLFSAGIILGLDILYYSFFAGPYLVVFLKNFVLLVFLALFFYYNHLWAAGDSKLLLVVSLAIPGRIYALKGYTESSGAMLIVFAFSLAFIWVVTSALYTGIRQHNLFSLHLQSFDLKNIILSYFFMVGCLQIIDLIVQVIWQASFSKNAVLMKVLYCLIVLLLVSVRDRLTERQIGIFTMGVWGIIGLLLIPKFVSLSMQLSFYPLFIVLLILPIRLAIEKYNYQVLATEQVKAGQILSAGTVLGFLPSKVRGLPQGVTEDLRSRITAEEAESVRRWRSSKYGKPEIIIVRKIPFAIFITLGTIIFVLIEVVIL